MKNFKVACISLVRLIQVAFVGRILFFQETWVLKKNEDNFRQSKGYPKGSLRAFRQLCTVLVVGLDTFVSPFVGLLKVGYMLLVVLWGCCFAVLRVALLG